MTPFSVYAQLTKSEFIRLTLRRTYKNPRTIIIFVAGCLGILYLCLQLAGVLPQDNDNRWFVVIAAAYFVVAYPLLITLMASRNYKASTFIRQGITYAFSEEGVDLSGNKDLEMHLGWSQITKKQGVDKYLLLFTGGASAFIIPKEQFTDEELAFIGDKVPKGRM
jgi:hypothetical protein